ncbi:SDR family oxidoreductase [Polycladidibacter stylochi]|uniref:SDR family oxidoreductase n=1 Tax=Polycladidibacter stylochi TaxID=1807766 RepID=UPI00082E7D54|nr:NAD(P)H-binding protein [Pseudovibrio stylochi]
MLQLQGKTIVVAGATGTLGRNIVEELLNVGAKPRVLLRDINKASLFEFSNAIEYFEAQATELESLEGLFKGVHGCISALGKTRQADKQNYWQVDYGANSHLLQMAIDAHLQFFSYVHVIGNAQQNGSQLFTAKQAFVDSLQQSPIESYVVRPSGFFSDLAEVFTMAQKGRVWLIGNGQQPVTPIHPRDLAKEVVRALLKGQRDITVGGPQTITQDDIAKLAFSVLGQKSKTSHIPEWLITALLGVVSSMTPQRFWGPFEFFHEAMKNDMSAPHYGKETLENFFLELKRKKA